MEKSNLIKTKTERVICNRFDRKVCESLGCNLHQNGMNLDNGQYVSTKFSKPFFKYLQNIKCLTDVSNVVSS